MSLSNPIIKKFDIKSGLQRVKNEAQKVLIIGQMTSVGTATPSVVVNDVASADVNTLFGANSMCATAYRAIERAIEVANEPLRVDVLPLEDGTTSTAAEGTITLTGTATASGTLTFSFGSSLNNTYTIDVAIGDTAEDIGGEIVTVMASDATRLVTPGHALGVVTLTAVNKGAVGNIIGLEYTGSVAGITIVTTAISGGTGEPDDIADKSAYAAISNEIRYQGIVYPSEFGAIGNQGLEEFIDPRFSVNNRILDGQVFIGDQNTLANVKTFAATFNNKAITVIGNKAIDTNNLRGGALLEMDYVLAATEAAVRAVRFIDGAQIAPYIVGTAGSLDDVGGMALASLPYMNTPLTNLLPLADPNNFWTDEEVTELLDAGVSVIGNNINNTIPITGQMVTTYLTDDLSDPDVTFKYLNYFDTFTTIREYMFNNLKTRFAQSRLVEGDVIPGRNDANANTITSYILSLYQDLAGLALVERGREEVKFFADNLKVTLDKANGAVAIEMAVVPVVQLRSFEIVMQIVFSINL
jgi:phage tail sheath gpL-like